MQYFDYVTSKSTANSYLEVWQEKQAVLICHNRRYPSFSEHCHLIFAVDNDFDWLSEPWRYPDPWDVHPIFCLEDYLKYLCKEADLDFDVLFASIRDSEWFKSDFEGGVPSG